MEGAHTLAFLVNVFSVGQRELSVSSEDAEGPLLTASLLQFPSETYTHAQGCSQQHCRYHKILRLTVINNN